MSIPDFQTVMLPLLQAIADGREHVMRNVTKAIADRFGLTEEERKEMLPSGGATLIANRVGWAKTYLKNARLIEQPVRGVVKLTEDGKRLLSENLPSIDLAYLEKYPGYIEFRRKKGNAEDEGRTDEVEVTPTETPEELLETGYHSLRQALAAELLQQVMDMSSTFLEHLAVELLVKMGYGGLIEDAGQAVGKTADGGIDGRIKEDRLGLDEIVIQTKKWTGSVGSPEIAAFAGSMEANKARKGVFITTATFSKPAVEFAKVLSAKVVLIDGLQLANLMIEYGVGVTTYRTLVLRKLDSDYFQED